MYLYVPLSLTVCGGVTQLGLLRELLCLRLYPDEEGHCTTAVLVAVIVM